MIPKIKYNNTSPAIDFIAIGIITIIIGPMRLIFFSNTVTGYLDPNAPDSNEPNIVDNTKLNRKNG